MNVITANRPQHTKNRFMAGGLLGIGGAALVASGYHVGGGLVLLWATSIVVSAELEHRKHNREVAQRAEDERKLAKILTDDFAALDVIVSDVRWLGSESKVVCYKYPIKVERGFRQHLLARSNRGRWFVVEYELDRLTITARRVEECTESEARSWLSRDRDAYVELFGMPETA